MQKKEHLIFGQAILMLIIIIVFGSIITLEKGNIFLRKQIQKKIENYYKQHYQNKELESSDLIYDKKEHIYYITYTNKTNKDHDFKIIYDKNKISSTYDNDYLKGKQLLKTKSKEIKKEWDQIFKDTIYQSCNIIFYHLDNYQEKQKQKIIKDNNLKESGLYQINCLIDTYDHSDKNVNELFKTLDMMATTNKFLPKNYTLTLRDNGIIKEITKEKGEL